MRRITLTGTPGAGKTTVIEALAERGHDTVRESGTDVIHEMFAEGITEPWTHSSFVSRVVTEQMARLHAPTASSLQFHDRSPVCTLALARFIEHEPSAELLAALDEITTHVPYETAAFLVRPLGFVTPTAARQISYEDSLVFEQLHIEAYREQGFELIDVPPMSVADRVDFILARV